MNLDSKIYDIVLAAIPKSDERCPFIAPFLLKSSLQKNGFKCKAVDWNRDLYERTKDSTLFARNLTFNRKENFDIIWNKQLKYICFEWIKELQKYNPNWFGVSIFSQRNVHMARKILSLVRKKLSNTKIIIGGFMIGDNYKIGPTFLKEGLTDYFVDGDGEDAIVNLLNGNYNFPGINKIKTGIPVNLNDAYIPDYSDVSHYNYKFYNTYNSRGCINNCLFCDENLYSHGYRFRKAESIIEEMKTVNKQCGNRTFVFVDSLINGNPKEFRKFCNLIRNKNFRWRGSLLCKKWMNEEDFVNAAEAGLTSISVGVESGSERIRDEMRKGYSNEVLYNCARHAATNNVMFSANIIVGWPTETEEDFQETLDFISFLSNYKYIEINPGPTLQIGKKSRTYIKYKMTSDENNKWVYKDNIYELRKDRWNRLVDHCKIMNVSVLEHHRDRVEETYNDISA